MLRRFAGPKVGSWIRSAFRRSTLQTRPVTEDPSRSGLPSGPVLDWIA